ncbi:MAG TPA: carboxypeptidase-like regulatory domain-containing protein, partial [Candidatus Acidoferrales bacterium]|nr:carboxypeptidase-like regulatory domain-containing protein [Candidatus Acidoferrales bacterium]
MDFNRGRFLFLLVSILLLAAPAYAQVTTGTVAGTVVDPTDAVVPGATVTLANLDTGLTREMQTDDTGHFLFDRVPPGRYRLTISASNFQNIEISALNVTIGKDTSVGQLRLTVGPTQQTVLVEAGAAPLLQTGGAQISGNYENRILTDNMWGLFGVDALAYLTPGITPGFGNINQNTGTGVGNSFATATNTGNSISSNGLRSRFTNFTLDGQDNNDISIGGPAFFVDIPDIVEEFQISTNQFNADQGRSAGASVNIVTKTGGNDLHGSAWWFYGNSAALDGTSSDEARAGFKKAAKFMDHQWGFTVGGPLVKNKLFGFGAYQGIRQTFDAFSDPTAFGLDLAPGGLDQLRAAGFDANSTTIDGIVAHTGFGLSTGNPFCQVGRLSDVTAGDLGAVSIDPTSTFALFDLEQLDQAGNLVAAATGVPFCSIGRFIPGAFKQFEMLYKLDYVGRKSTMGGKYLIQQQTSGPFDDGLLNGNTVNVPARSQYVDFHHTYQFTPRVLNEFRFSYGRLFVAFEGGTGANHNDPLANPINIFFSGPFNPTGNSLGFPQARTVNNFQWQDHVSIVKGRHNVKAGIEFRRIRDANDLLFLANGLGVGFNGFGSFFRNGSVTTNGFLCLADIDPSACGPASYEELLMNQLALAQKDFAEFRFHVFHTQQFYYLQDDFRLKPNLTLNLGVRYEYSGQPVNRIADQMVARESDPSTAFWDTTLPVELRTLPRLPGDKNNFSPRIGFAYTPRFWKAVFGEDKTVIRGGYGISYDVGFENPINNIATGAPR